VHRLSAIAPRLATFAPRLGLFVVMAAAGAILTFLVVALLNRPELVSTASDRATIVGSDGGAGLSPVAFNLVDSGDPVPVPQLPAADLAIAAEAAEPPPLNPIGLPRPRFVSQFDGGPFDGANCTLASGAMLAEVGWNIITDGSTLRPLQDDQAGGTGLDDLAQALSRGYGVQLNYGGITIPQLQALLTAGYAVVLQGDYSKFVIPFTGQESFEGPHAIYLDAFFPGDGVTPPGYYVMDPIFKGHSGYDGQWVPAPIVEAFGTSFGAFGSVAAAWAFPAGGSAPDITSPNVPPLPETPGATPTPPAGATPPPIPPEPGDEEPVAPPDLEPIDGTVTIGPEVIDPSVSVCLAEPTPPECPPGLPGTIVDESAGGALTASPTIEVVWVGSPGPNRVLVGYKVNPPIPGTIEFWRAGQPSVVVETAPTVGSIDLGAGPTYLASLPVLGATSYQFQVAVTGDGGTVTRTPVGTFTTGPGVARFDVALQQTAGPKFGIEAALTPFSRLSANALAPPLLSCVGIGTGGTCQLEVSAGGGSSACPSPISLGGLEFCLALPELIAGTPIVPACQTAKVDYRVEGLPSGAVVVRAYPTSPARYLDGTLTQRSVLESVGPAGEGSVTIGCLTPGLTYNVAIDLEGDALGTLLTRTLRVPAGR
jgi:hypothetical protein